MAKWSDGLKSKIGKLVTESSVSKKEGLYGKGKKVLGFDTSSLTPEEIETIQRMRKENSESRLKKG